MLKAEIAIDHKHCWASEISLKFPRLQLLLLHPASLSPKTSNTMLYAWDKKNNTFKSLISYLKEKKQEKEIKILSFDIIEKKLNSIFINILSEVKGSLVRRVISHDCLIQEPIKLKQGKEVWTIFTTKKSNIKKVIDDFSKVGTVELNYVKEVIFEETNLTNKQKEALKTAYSSGYYEWPRNINLDKLAKKMNLSSSALRERLRKSENKLIEDIIDKL